MSKVALIIGITGQDGTYLAELLLAKGYYVHGIKRRASLFNTHRIDHLYKDPHERNNRLILHYGDLTDSSSLNAIIKKIQPDEIYNLGAQSHVHVSYENPEYTANVNALGALRVLENVRILNLGNKTRIYQASTSEMFGLVQTVPQTEETQFHPRSPYAISKLFAHWSMINYREAYGMFACNGILFNHESPLRGETFITRKITRALSRIKLGLQECLYVGNLESKRDWGHAKDYVEMQWLMLQQDKPDDYVIATGVQFSIKQFIDLTAQELNLPLTWQGEGLHTKAYDNMGNIRIAVDPRYFRPAEVDNLIGDASKARRLLGWKPKYNFRDLVKEMILADLELAKEERVAQSNKKILCELY